MERQTISIMKACELVGVSRRTIYNWIAAGKVEYVRTAGGSIRIFVDTLWRAARRQHARRVQPRGVDSRTGPDRGRAHVNPSTIPLETGPQARSADLRGLFHQLNNQLGIILAHAELMESKAPDAAQRARASHVVNAALEAMAVTRAIRDHAGRVTRRPARSSSPADRFPPSLPVTALGVDAALVVKTIGAFGPSLPSRSRHCTPPPHDVVRKSLH